MTGCAAAVRRGAAATVLCLASCGQLTGGEPAPEPTPPPPAGAPTWRDVDGGADYYAAFDPTLPGGPGAFPVGVWLADVVEPSDVVADRRAGITTYVDLTTNSDPDLLAGSGAGVLLSRDEPFADGYVLADEVDMWAGAGEAGWTGRWPGQGAICDPEADPCGYTVQATVRGNLPAGGLAYANYGKGVAFSLPDDDAARFVNAFADVVSVSAYWFTDPRICGAGEGGRLLADGADVPAATCRRGASYGATVDRARSLVRPAGARPVWAFVELGHPFTEDDAPTITGPQVRAAVWSSVIHGARGVVYFAHSFGGDCRSYHLLRDACGAQVRAWATQVNRQLADLAPALNAPFLDGALGVAGPADAAVKVLDGEQYLLAASTGTGPADVTFAPLCASDGPVEVLGEGREVEIAGGRFTDAFADADDVHLYRYAHDADAAPGCAP